MGATLITVRTQPAAAAAANVECSNQTLTAAVVTANLIVPQGKFCDLEGTTVMGNATVNQSGGLLADSGSNISGYVYIARSSQFAAFNSSTVSGNVICQN